MNSEKSGTPPMRKTSGTKPFSRKWGGVSFSKPFGANVLTRKPDLAECPVLMGWPYYGSSQHGKCCYKQISPVSRISGNASLGGRALKTTLYQPPLECSVTL